MAAPQPKGGNLTDLEYALAERCEQSLHTFTVNAWPYLDPVEFIDGRHLEVQGEVSRVWLFAAPRASTWKHS